jgi:hypothetical protein
MKKLLVDIAVLLALGLAVTGLAIGAIAAINHLAPELLK